MKKYLILVMAYILFGLYAFPAIAQTKKNEH